MTTQDPLSGPAFLNLKLFTIFQLSGFFYFVIFQICFYISCNAKLKPHSRIQTRQKDGNQGINLYKKELKSVPRELFNHPKARNVTWLNLACNTLVYNNNGIYVNVDKVSTPG